MRAAQSLVGKSQLEFEGLDLPGLSLGRIVLASLLTIILGIGGSLAWAAAAQIDTAVPGAGVIISNGKRKTITILESGLLVGLLVHEGDHVVAGQSLMRLDDVQARAARDQASTQYWTATAKLARLTAEGLDQHEIQFPDALERAAADPTVQAAMSLEQHQFDARWGAFNASVQVQERKVAQAEAQINALRAQIGANGIKLALTREQLANVDFLLTKGLDTKPHQLDLRRAEAETRGLIGQLAGQLTQTQQSIAQINSETLSAEEARHSDISRERSETSAAQADAQQRLIAATDQLAKRIVTAPEAGVVTDLKFFTVGSSVAAGQPIMDLVPASSTLLVEANVSPADVEHLAIGQPVNVRLTAYKAHRVPVIPGHLVYVGGDRQMDASNTPVFVVRVQIDTEALRHLDGVVLLPGMPAEVLIINGRRSVLSFLISPITDSLGKSMHEE